MPISKAHTVGLIWYNKALIIMNIMENSMFYEEYTSERFFSEITTEEDARELVWRSRFQGKTFECPHCQFEQFYAHTSRPEVRTCKACRRQTRVRAGTIFEASKTPCYFGSKHYFISCRVSVACLPWSYNVIRLKILWSGLGPCSKKSERPYSNETKTIKWVQA